MIAHDVEQNTEEWFSLRAGMPTASEFKKIITSKGEPSKQMGAYAALLAAEKYAGGRLERWEGNQWTERGHELEAEARRSYTFTANEEVVSVGFCENYGAGCSPDGLVGDSGLFENKCLSPQQHVITLSYFDKHGRPQADYIPQVQGQMWVTGRDWCDLHFYHPALPSLTIRVERDDEFHASLAEQIERTLAERDRLARVLEAA